MKKIEVVRRGELKAGYSTQGILREKAFEAKNVLVSRSRVAGGVVSAWHHHGSRELYAFLLSGRLRLEYGPRGKRALELNPGDFFRIPPRLVHRDVNPEEKHGLVVVNILVGRGDPVVNVQGPKGGRVRRTKR